MFIIPQVNNLSFGEQMAPLFTESAKSNKQMRETLFNIQTR